LVMAKSDTPILTVGQLEEWTARKAELETRLRETQEELTGIVRLLEAANILLGEMKDAPVPAVSASPAAVPPAGSDTVPGAILKVAAAYPDGASPNEIKGSLAVSGFDMTRLDASPGYIYTVLGRLVARGKMEKRRNGNYRIKPVLSSPQGETGAAEAPANS
jgi:hypothetical protein